MTVERFREAFPRARWRDDMGMWFLPGLQAEKRLTAWPSQRSGESASYPARLYPNTMTSGPRRPNAVGAGIRCIKMLCRHCSCLDDPCRSRRVPEGTGEVVAPSIAERFYPGIPTGTAALLWADWRRPSHAELVQTWPARLAPSPAELAGGWWQPTIKVLREERRRAAPLERAQATRRANVLG